MPKRSGIWYSGRLVVVESISLHERNSDRRDESTLECMVKKGKENNHPSGEHFIWWDKLGVACSPIIKS